MDRSFYLDDRHVVAISVLSLVRLNVGDDSRDLFIIRTAPGPSNYLVADLL